MQLFTAFVIDISSCDSSDYSIGSSLKAYWALEDVA